MIPSPTLAIPLLLLLTLSCAMETKTQPRGQPGETPQEPSQITLPNGFAPEGIASQGDFIYVGSIPTGAVYRANVRTGAGSIVVPAAEGRAAIGLKVSDAGRLFVAGGPTGKAFIYDANSGELLRTHEFAQAPTFINDVVLTADAAWFTDSRNPVLYGVGLQGEEGVAVLPLSGDFQMAEGNNLNGIAWNGSSLIAVQSNKGLLFRIDPMTGTTSQIAVDGGPLVNGDGLLLDGQTLFVVQNRMNQVAAVELSADFASGNVRTRVSAPGFDVPTTIAAIGSDLFAVNARFGTEVTPDTSYSVVRFPRP